MREGIFLVDAMVLWYENPSKNIRVVLCNEPRGFERPTPSFWGFHVTAADFKRRSPDNFHCFQQFLHLELPTQVSHRATNGFGVALRLFETAQ